MLVRGASCAVIYLPASPAFPCTHPPTHARTLPPPARTQSLQLLDILIKNGSERCVDAAREYSTNRLRALESFEHMAEGKDQGAGIRALAKQIGVLLKDSSAIREERDKAKKLRDKFVGMSGAHAGGGGGVGGGGSGFGSSSGGFSSSSGGFGSSGFGSDGGDQWGSSRDVGSSRSRDRGEDDSPRVDVDRSSSGVTRAARGGRAPVVPTSAPASEDFESFGAPAQAPAKEAVGRRGRPAAAAPADDMFAPSVTHDDDFSSAFSTAVSVKPAAPASAAANFDDDFGSFGAPTPAAAKPAAASRPRPIAAPAASGRTTFAPPKAAVAPAPTPAALAAPPADDGFDDLSFAAPSAPSAKQPQPPAAAFDPFDTANSGSGSSSGAGGSSSGLGDLSGLATADFAPFASADPFAAPPPAATAGGLYGLYAVPMTSAQQQQQQQQQQHHQQSGSGAPADTDLNRLVSLDDGFKGGKGAWAASCGKPAMRALPRRANHFFLPTRVCTSFPRPLMRRPLHIPRQESCCPPQRDLKSCAC